MKQEALNGFILYTTIYKQNKPLIYSRQVESTNLNPPPLANPSAALAMEGSVRLTVIYYSIIIPYSLLLCSCTSNVNELCKCYKL